jgi:hypothetical protein
MKINRASIYARRSSEKLGANSCAEQVRLLQAFLDSDSAAEADVTEESGDERLTQV